MKLAIFGGTGFLGYDFVQLVAANPDVELTVYSTSPKSLVNLARHELDIRLMAVAQFETLDLDGDTDYIINFSHPFGLRDTLSPRAQIDLFVDFLARQKSRIPDLKLIHLSTMSVYEPFASSAAYPESSHLAPPKSDTYASDKVYIESRIKGLAGALDWQIHLRPTIVYGPFCRPWTDRLLGAFRDGAVIYRDLSGKIQPIYGHDVSRFIRDCLSRFEPGTYNLAGEEEMSWMEFFRFFEGIVSVGNLVHEPDALPAEHGPSVGFLRFFFDNVRELMHVISQEESFVRLASPVVRMLPRALVVWARDNLFGGETGGVSRPRTLSPFASNFYAENRMVSMTGFRRRFPEFEFTGMAATEQELKNYYEYRFTDKPL